MIDRSYKALLVALAATLVLAALPDRWLGRLHDLADIANFGLTPLREGVNAATRFVRPPVGPSYDGLDDASLETLYAEIEAWRTRFYRLQLHSRELEQQIALLKQVPVEKFNVDVVRVMARITGRNPKDTHVAIELNKGRRDGVYPGTIGVVFGNHVVGRVGEVHSQVRSTLIPINSEASGLVLARVVSDDLELAPERSWPLVQLIPQADGSYLAEAGNEHDIRVGDRVILDDAAWPLAQAMTIGTVVSIGPKDEQPLRNRLVVEPVYRQRDLTSVILIVEQGSGGGGGSDGSAGP